MITRPMQREMPVSVTRPKPESSTANAGPLAEYRPAWYEKIANKFRSNSK